MILYNSENSIRDVRQFFRPFFRYCSIVKCTLSLYSSDLSMKLDYQILLKSFSLTLLSRSTPGMTCALFRQLTASARSFWIVDTFLL